MSKEKLMQIAVVLGGVVVLVILVVVFFFALVPRTQTKPEDYLTYSLGNLGSFPPELVLFREAAPVAVPAQTLYGICRLPGAGFAVTGDTSVFIFDANKKLIRTIPLTETAESLSALAGDGGQKSALLFLGMRDHIEVWNSDGEKLDEWTSLGELAQIVSVAASRDLIYAADSGNKTIACFDRGGRLLRFLGAPRADFQGFLIPGHCFDIALDSKGALWAVDPGRLKVVRLSPAGAVLASWGKTTTLPEGFWGCCNPVHISIFADDSFVVQEKGILAVKLFSKDGSFNGIVAGPDSFHESLSSLDLAASPAGEVYVVDTFTKTVRVFVRKGTGS